MHHKTNQMRVGFLVMIVVFTTNVSLLAFNTGRILFSENNLILFLTDIVSNYDERTQDGVIHKTLSKKISDDYDQLSPESKKQNGMESLIALMVTGTIHPDDYTSVLHGLVPRQMVQDITAQVISPLATWLDSDAVYPDIKIEMAGIQENFRQLAPILANYPFRILPPCNEDQQQSLDQEFQKGPQPGFIPNCRPVGDVILMEKVETSFQKIVMKGADKIPTVIPVNELINPRSSKNDIPEICKSSCMACHQHGEYRKDGHLNNWISLKKNLLRIRTVMSMFWILPLVFLLVIIYIVRKNKKQIITWTGRAVFLSGLTSLLFAYYLGYHFGPILPEAAAQYIELSLYQAIGAAMFNPSLIVLVLGALAMISSRFYRT